MLLLALPYEFAGDNAVICIGGEECEERNSRVCRIPLGKTRSPYLYSIADIETQC